MRKAFDANVPKLRPRLGAARAATLSGNEGAPAPAVGSTTPGEIRAEPPIARTTATPSASSPQTAGPMSTSTSTSTSTPTSTLSPGSDLLSRKERLDSIKRRVAEASRPQPRVPAIPAEPARAAESVLGLVRDLEDELNRAREREETFRRDLDEARRELSRISAEGRSAAEQLALAQQELDEKRGILAELLGEMHALEEERDLSLRRAQALAALDEERSKLLDELGRRADEESRLRQERESEVDRLSEELQVTSADGARLRATIGELARERDQLGADLERTGRERDELVEAKRALESVHAALAQARARIA